MGCLKVISHIVKFQSSHIVYTSRFEYECFAQIRFLSQILSPLVKTDLSTIDFMQELRLNLYITRLLGLVGKISGMIGCLKPDYTI